MLVNYDRAFPALTALTCLSASAYVVFYFTNDASTFAELACCCCTAAFAAMMAWSYWYGLTKCSHARVGKTQLPRLACVAALVTIKYAFIYASMWKYDRNTFGGPTLHSDNLRAMVDMLYFSYTNILGPGLGDVYATCTLGRLIVLWQTLYTLVFVVFAFVKAMEYSDSFDDAHPGDHEEFWSSGRASLTLVGALLSLLAYVAVYLMIPYTNALEVVLCACFAACASCTCFLYAAYLAGPSIKRRSQMHFARLALLFALINLAGGAICASLYKHDQSAFNIGSPPQSRLDALLQMMYFSVTSMAGPGLADVHPAGTSARLALAWVMTHAPLLLTFAGAKVGDYVKCNREVASSRANAFVMP